jgi:hypothetical protein
MVLFLHKNTLWFYNRLTFYIRIKSEHGLFFFNEISKQPLKNNELSNQILREKLKY